MRFRAKDSAIWEQIALLGANHIARIASAFKMDLTKLWTPIKFDQISNKTIKTIKLLKFSPKSFVFTVEHFYILSKFIPLFQI